MFQKQQSTVTLLLHGKSIVQHKKHTILWKRFQCLILVPVRLDVLPVTHVCMLTLAPAWTTLFMLQYASIYMLCT